METLKPNSVTSLTEDAMVETRDSSWEGSEEIDCMDDYEYEIMQDGPKQPAIILTSNQSYGLRPNIQPQYRSNIDLSESCYDDTRIERSTAPPSPKEHAEGPFHHDVQLHHWHEMYDKLGKLLGKEEKFPVSPTRTTMSTSRSQIFLPKNDYFETDYDDTLSVAQREERMRSLRPVPAPKPRVFRSPRGSVRQKLKPLKRSSSISSLPLAPRRCVNI